MPRGEDFKRFHQKRRERAAMEKNVRLQKQAQPGEIAIKGAITKPDVEGRQPERTRQTPKPPPVDPDLIGDLNSGDL